MVSRTVRACRPRPRSATEGGCVLVPHCDPDVLGESCSALRARRAAAEQLPRAALSQGGTPRRVPEAPRAPPGARAACARARRCDRPDSRSSRSAGSSSGQLTRDQHDAWWTTLIGKESQCPKTAPTGRAPIRAQGRPGATRVPAEPGAARSRSPRRLRRLDHVEVAGARELDQLHVVAGFTSGDGIRGLCVGGTTSSREPCTRSCGTPSGRSPAGEAAAYRSAPRGACRRATPRRLRRRSPSAAPATRSATPASETARLGRTAGTTPGAPAGSRSRAASQGELTAGGVPDHRNPRRVGLLDRRERVDGGRRVQQGARPTAAFLTDAPVLDVPGEEAVRRQVARERRVIASGPSPPARSRRGAARPPATERPHLRANAGSQPGRDGRRTDDRRRRQHHVHPRQPSNIVFQASSSRQQMAVALERLEHPVDVLLDVVEVRGDAEAAVARRRHDPSAASSRTSASTPEEATQTSAPRCCSGRV